MSRGMQTSSGDRRDKETSSLPEPAEGIRRADPLGFRNAER